MTKLPVLFVSCRVENLQVRNEAGTGPARMVWDKEYRSVLLIGSTSNSDHPKIRPIAGEGTQVGVLRTLLAEQGFTPQIDACGSERRQKLVSNLLNREPGEITEVSLSTGMLEMDYHRIGQCLEAMREDGVLIICLDDHTRQQDQNDFSLENRRLRNILNDWVRNRQWDSVISFNGNTRPPTAAATLENPTLCLLRAAFSLGGQTYPQRIFSSGMSTSGRTVSGFGWMR